MQYNEKIVLKLNKCISIVIRIIRKGWLFYLTKSPTIARWTIKYVVCVSKLGDA